jgi:hypothetical protein
VNTKVWGVFAVWWPKRQCVEWCRVAGACACVLTRGCRGWQLLGAAGECCGWCEGPSGLSSRCTVCWRRCFVLVWLAWCFTSTCSPHGDDTGCTAWHTLRLPRPVCATLDRAFARATCRDKDKQGAACNQCQSLCNQSTRSARCRWSRPSTRAHTTQSQRRNTPQLS